VENHDGTIDYTSDAAWGTEFRIRLPVQPKHRLRSLDHELDHD
jgi:signal transduction histidine kinase